MNFLAHLHLASLASSSLVGNLMADYVRGDPLPHWPADIAAGIALHRRLDALTDALPEVRNAKRLFRDSTRRVAPITLDVVWDHFLSRHWDRLVTDQPLPLFLAQAQRQIEPMLPQSPEGFQRLNHYLWRERWMERYAEADYLQQVLRGMASRRPRLAALSDSWTDFHANYSAFETLFWQFYPRLMARAAAQQL
ncbi:ACP phosphodiesterase [Mixta intestinalis]|uniref:Acyl carrier protein phosphodiesterase n=1 Tax=Mixta intestinalis TaxID=1615494 RepID=A0A6P1PVM9_9GAMM|nr:ACP phosphodiesterase [Mixta intestinalis]QHM70112.1 Acyl carrier protein phosphodiesterase [Mixta intestinalis]